MARQLEVVRSDAMTLAQETESYEAAKRAREEEKIRGLLTRPGGQCGGEGDYGKNTKGKGKGPKGNGKSKGGSDGNQRKGDDARKDDKGWQNKKDK